MSKELFGKAFKCKNNAMEDSSQESFRAYNSTF